VIGFSAICMTPSYLDHVHLPDLLFINPLRSTCRDQLFHFFSSSIVTLLTMDQGDQPLYRLLDLRRTLCQMGKSDWAYLLIGLDSVQLANDEVSAAFSE